MPRDGISIYFSIKDGGSAVLKSIGDQTKALDKDTQSLAQSQEALRRANAPLIKSQQEMRERLEEVKRQVAENRREWTQYNNELARDAMLDAIAEQDELRRSLRDVGDQITSNEREYRRMRETIRKGAVEDGGGSPGGGSGMLAQMGQAGLYAMAGQVASQWAETFATSALGSSGGGLFASALSGAGSGAAIGTAIMPGIGTAIGAALGAGAGLLTGGAEIYQRRDDAFKGYYGDLYDAVKSATEDGIAQGTTTAAGRETDLLGFTTLLGGRRQAEGFLGSLVEKANHTPFLYDDLTAMSKTLATYGFKDAPQAGELGILESLTTIGDAGAALGHSTADMTAVATALGRMLSSNKASLEYLNILNDRGINAVGYLAQARGQSVGATYEAISKGEIAGGDAVNKILAAMEEAFGGSMEDQSKTFAGLSSTLEGLTAEISNAGGEGYNQVRKGGIQAEIDAYDGPLGKELKAVNTLAGENRAALENLREEYTREALGAVLLGEKTTLFRGDEAQQLQGMAQEYRMAAAEYDLYGTRDSAMTMEQLKETAEAMATAAFESSEQYQMLQDKEVDQIAAIRDNIAATESLTAAFNSYRIQQEQSKGRGVGFFNLLGTANAAIVDDSEYDPNTLTGASSRAMGQGTVPYDGFPALLHQGERVLTASEARAQDRGGGVTVSIGSVTVGGGAGELDTWAIATAIAQELERAAIAAAPQ